MGGAQVVRVELVYAEWRHVILQPTSQLSRQPLSRPDFPGGDVGSPTAAALSHSWQGSARAPDARRGVAALLQMATAFASFQGPTVTGSSSGPLVCCFHEIKEFSALPETSSATCWWHLEGRGRRRHQELRASLH